MQISANHKKSFAEAYESLNSRQKNAVDAIEGPVLVIAGPGTGKTQILAVRIGKILMETDTLPDNILCLTYTDAGTIAMRKRLLDFIGPDAYRVHIYTFHAFCNEVIQANLDYFGKRELEPISELENVNLIENLLQELPAGHPLKKYKDDKGYDVGRLNNFFKMMKDEDWDEVKMNAAIDNYLAGLPFHTDYIYKKQNPKKGIKVGDVKQKELKAETDRMEKTRAAANLYPEYVARMKALGRYDYSDMILWVIKAFKDPSPAGENMLRNYQERYLYFLVDEFQDTNGAQNEILNQLISYWDVPNVFAVGDDDQSIYEFQGARVKNIMDFYKSYEQDIEVVVLTENYRSHQAILDASRIIIEKNEERLIKKLPDLSKLLTASHPNRQLITEPAIYEYENPAQEHAGVIMAVEKLLQDGVPAEEIAVLYHKHAQAEELINVFEKRGLPYQVRKKINILELPLVKQMIHILTYLGDESKKPHSGEYLLFEIMHYPFFEIHPHDIAAISAWINSKRDKNITWRSVLSDITVLSTIKLRSYDAILKFEKNITAWIAETFNLTLQMLFEKVLNESGMLKYLLKGDNRVFNLEVITTLFDHIKSEGLRLPRLNIHQYIETLEQMEKHSIKIEIQKSISKKGGVNFITTHSSKGLEFEYVFLIGLNSDKWEKARVDPRKFSLPETLTFTEGSTKIEGLRRLFYVAMTRAKQHLFISYAAHTNEGKDSEPSSFVAELKDGTGIIQQPIHIDESLLAEYKITALMETPPVKIELFDKDYIQQKVEHIVMSASVLNAFISCPIKYYFERIVGVPSAKNDSMSFGSAVHFALRRMFERMRDSATQDFPGIEVVLSDFLFEMKRNEDCFTEKQFKNRLELGKQVITEYYTKYIDTFNKVVVLEYPIRNVIMDNVPITGVFDKVEFNGQEVNVVDYKTGNADRSKEKLNPPNEKNPDGGDYWRQIMFYKILLDNQKYKPWKMTSGEIDFLEKDENGELVKYKFEIVPTEVDIVKTQIKDVYQRIKNLEFTTGCGKEDCNWCNFVKDIIQN